MDRVEEQMSKHILGRTVLDSILREVVTSRLQAYNKLEEQARQEQLSKDASEIAVNGEAAAPAAQASEGGAQPQPAQVGAAI